jgi:hypothetical protein
MADSTWDTDLSSQQPVQISAAVADITSQHGSYQPSVLSAGGLALQD